MSEQFARGRTFLIAALAVKKDQQRIGVIRLVASGQERADRPAGRRLDFRRVEPLGGPDRSPVDVGMRHAESR